MKHYNFVRLGTLGYTANLFTREPKMRRHLPKMTERDWLAYTHWCAGFEKLMGF